MNHNGMQNMKIFVRNEFRRNKEENTVSKKQQMYFVMNNLAIPKQLIATGGAGLHV